MNVISEDDKGEVRWRENDRGNSGCDDDSGSGDNNNDRMSRVVVL